MILNAAKILNEFGRNRIFLQNACLGSIFFSHKNDYESGEKKLIIRVLDLSQDESFYNEYKIAC